MRSKKLRDSSRGKPCTFQIAGVCNGNWETTVPCHLPDESHGMALKSTDLAIADGCSACHDVVDGRVRCKEFEKHRDFYLRRAMVRTWGRWVDEELIKVA